MSKTTDISVSIAAINEWAAYVMRSMRNTMGLATPIGRVVPPRGTFRRKHLELLVALRRAFDR